MKKVNIFLMLLVIVSTRSLAQNAYSDAKKIDSLIKNTFDKEVNSVTLRPNDQTRLILDSILKNYIPKSTIDLLKNNWELDSTISNAFRENPFFQISGTVQSDKLDQFKNNSNSLLSGSPISYLGSLNVTNIADGIAQFLIKRGKEELNVAFFNRFKKFLDSTQECKVLFSQTIEVFKNVEPYRYSEFIQSLREGFIKDLGNLTISLNELIELPKYQVLLKNIPELRLAIRSSKIVAELSQADGAILPDSIITELAALSEWGEIDVNLGNSWKLLNIISESVRHIPNVTSNLSSKDSVTSCWITLSDVNALIKDPVTLRIFLGLVYQKADKIFFKIKDQNISVRDFMKANSDNILTVSSLFENFVTLANDIDITIKDFKDKQKNSRLDKEDYYSYINKAINITEYGFKAANTIISFQSKDTKNPDISENRFILIAKNGNNLYKNIYTKNYNNAVMNVYNILDQVFNNKNDLVQEKIAISQLDSTGGSNLSMAINKVEFLAGKTIEAILKYGNFMASVVKAESAEDVQNALDAAALPVGSYSIKQRSAFNVSVNGYIGYGWDIKSGVYAHGVYAPVGISFSRGTFRKNGVTVTGFVSLIDVGSIATYRLNDDSTKTLKQEIRLESIFSPSAQIFIEPIRNFPLAIGCGWRRTPKLFYSNKTDFKAIASENVFNISILIDIPIFTITNKPYYKKYNSNSLNQ